MANHLPFLPSVGQRPSVTDFRRLRDAIRACWLLDGNGYKVDRTPQGVRLRVQGVTNFIGGGGSSRPGRFDLTVSRNEPETEGESPTYNFSLSNQFVRIGGKTYDADCEAATYADVPCILCIFIDISGSAPVFEINTCADLEDLNDCESDPNVYILPLYTIDENGSITCDWRIGLDAVMSEFGSINS